MGQHEQIDQLIDMLYETAVSALDGCVWCELLPGVCSTFDATASGLIAHDFASGVATVHHGYDVETRSRGHQNGTPRDQAGALYDLSHYREGAVFFSDDARAGDQVIGADLCRLRSGGATVIQLCGMITRERSQGYLISLARPTEAPRFDNADQEVLARLLPHLKRSLRLRDEVVHRRFERQSLLDLMDQLPVAVLMVTQSGLVRLRNHTADHLLGQRDGICLRSGYLAGRAERITAALRRLIANAATRPADSDDVACGEHMVIPRGPDRLPLISVVYAGRAADDRSEPVAVMLIKDPQVDSAQSLTDFIKVYDITRAEARLLKFLGNGYGLFEAAKELAITKNTARTHMRNIYAKVGIHRQADLVRLLHRFALF